jgi:hypothetical protein
MHLGDDNFADCFLDNIIYAISFLDNFSVPTIYFPPFGGFGSEFIWPHFQGSAG